MKRKSPVNPKALVEGMDQNLPLPERNSERFSGYGVMGLTFSSGHALALRRFPASSLGAGYTSVWHRNPAGEWVFYQDVEPQLACARYFGKNVSKTLNRDIAINWISDFRFEVTIKEDVNLQWTISLKPTSATKIMNTMSNMVPGSLWYNKLFLKTMSGVAGSMLNVGHIGLCGLAPNGQYFIANPKLIWMIDSSKASLQGEDFGSIGPLKKQSRLADFWIPQRGVFAIGDASFEAYDPSRHSLTTALQSIG